MRAPCIILGLFGSGGSIPIIILKNYIHRMQQNEYILMQKNEYILSYSARK